MNETVHPTKFDKPFVASERSGTWQDGDCLYNGTRVVDGITPSANLYQQTLGVNARLLTVDATVTLGVHNCINTADIADCKGVMSADGNPGVLDVQGATINAAAGDLFAGHSQGGAGRSTTGDGAAAAAGSGGNSMGGNPGLCALVDGTRGAVTNTTAMSATNRKQYRRAQSDNLRRTITGTAIAAVHTGNCGPAGGCNVGTGTATSGSSGNPGVPTEVRCRKFIGRAAGRLTSRGSKGGNGARTGDGIGGGGSAGPGGNVKLICDEAVFETGFVIDAWGGAISLGAPTPTYDSEVGAPGTVDVIVGGVPYPRRIVWWVGDSITLGSGDTDTVAAGGRRAMSMHYKVYGPLPWQPVGSVVGGSFGPKECTAVSGETCAQIAARLIDEAPAFLAARENWPAPVVVIHAGTNDLSGDLDAAVASLLTGYAACYAANPAAIVFGAKIIDRSTLTANVESFNAKLVTAVAGLAAAVRPTLIDYYTAVGPYSATQYAAVNHPNLIGYRLMANADRTAFTAAGI